MAGSTQIRNNEQVNLLRSDFQARYEPNFALANAVSTILALPGLRGFWPLSSVDYATATQGRDIAGGGYHLANNNGVTFGYWANSLIPVANFNGVNQYLSRADGGVANWADIRGTETYIAAGQRGLTLGCWFNSNSLTADQTLISKYGAAGTRSYFLVARGDVAGDPVQLFISDDGTNTTTLNSAGAYPANTWTFAAGRFNDALAGTEMAVWINDTRTDGATARNSIFDSAQAFGIGALTIPSAYMSGSISLAFLCAAACSDAQVLNVYQQTRALFGV